MDIYPETTLETVVSITVCLCGSIMWAFVVAATTSLLAGMDQGAQRARNEAEMSAPPSLQLWMHRSSPALTLTLTCGGPAVRSMNHFMRFRRVPRRLRLMVNQYQQCAPHANETRRRPIPTLPPPAARTSRLASHT
jgi:hypothetical protein